MTQKDKVLDRIKSAGYVDNFWAIQNRMLRLGAIIFDLEKEGYKFTRAFGKALGKDRNFHKNFYYFPAKKDSVPVGFANKFVSDYPPRPVDKSRQASFM